MTTTPPTTTDQRAARRAERIARVQEIADGVTTRMALGIGAMHKRTADGPHEVTFHGVTYSAATLAEAIKAARKGRKAR